MAPRSSKLRPSKLEGKPLGEHDGEPITRVKASITNAGDGLSEALSLAPVHLPLHAEGYLIVPFTVAKHHHEPLKDAEGEVLETAVLRAEGAFLVDPDLVEEVADKHMGRVTEHRRFVAEEREKAKGIGRMVGADGAVNPDAAVTT